MNIQKRINALRSSMAQKGIDIYIIPTADFHHSEYVEIISNSVNI